MNGNKPCMLIILDGWGVSAEKRGNAVAAADTPFLDHLHQTYPQATLQCAGEAVGLPAGIMGNSEVGHLNLGAGRVVYQDLLRIDRAIQDGSFQQNAVLNQAMDTVRDNGSALHLMGLVSDGGVHSQLAHLLALLDMARSKGLERVFVHPILDGRDTPPNGGECYVQTVARHMAETGTGRMATICGRYWAMDRDRRWDRIEQAYRLYTHGQGVAETDPLQAVKNAYARGETDEFVKPVVIQTEQGQPTAKIENGDGVIFFNFRADRAREITRSLNDPAFDAFKRESVPELSAYVCMTQYDETFDLPCAFPPVRLEKILGEVVSRAGLKQLRIAETEKYAHVTYFFNGGEELPFEGEDRCLVPSPREVATYDLKPEMSALKVTDQVMNRLQAENYDLIVLNFANMDMVGHTGVSTAAVKACETVDSCLARIIPEVLGQGGVALITADHGNAEQMLDKNGGIYTAHSHNPVPLILVADWAAGNPRGLNPVTLRDGKLGDIAPTLLELMKIDQPDEMTGKSLIKK